MSKHTRRPQKPKSAASALTIKLIEDRRRSNAAGPHVADPYRKPKYKRYDADLDDSDLTFFWEEDDDC